MTGHLSTNLKTIAFQMGMRTSNLHVLGCFWFRTILGAMGPRPSPIFYSLYHLLVDIFINFGANFGQFLEPFWGAILGPRSAQEVPRWAPEGRPDLQSTENLFLQKL